MKGRHSLILRIYTDLFGLWVSIDPADTRNHICNWEPGGLISVVVLHKHLLGTQDSYPRHAGCKNYMGPSCAASFGHKTGLFQSIRFPWWTSYQNELKWNQEDWNPHIHELHEWSSLDLVQSQLLSVRQLYIGCKMIAVLRPIIVSYYIEILSRLCQNICNSSSELTLAPKLSHSLDNPCTLQREGANVPIQWGSRFRTNSQSAWDLAVLIDASRKPSTRATINVNFPKL